MRSHGRQSRNAVRHWSFSCSAADQRSLGLRRRSEREPGGARAVRTARGSRSRQRRQPVTHRLSICWPTAYWRTSATGSISARSARAGSPHRRCRRRPSRAGAGHACRERAARPSTDTRAPSPCACGSTRRPEPAAPDRAVEPAAGTAAGVGCAAVVRQVGRPDRRHAASEPGAPGRRGAHAVRRPAACDHRRRTPRRGHDGCPRRHVPRDGQAHSGLGAAALPGARGRRAVPGGTGDPPADRRQPDRYRRRRTGSRASRQRRRAHRVLAVARQLGCSATATRNAKTLRTDARGRFSVVLPKPPAGQLIAGYRLRTTSCGRSYTLPLVLRAP
jgi:hypothetical protein